MVGVENVRATMSNFYSIFSHLKWFIDHTILPAGSVNFTENPSVEIETIAKKTGITDIQYVSPKDVSGKHALLKGPVILVNNDDTPEKQRFSIAHEIFHFIMREDSGADMPAVARQGETWKKQNAGSDEAVDEEIADYFAANLLIPTERFVLWEDKSNEEIARAFGVDAKCINKRRGEIEHELDLMVPQNQSSDAKIEKKDPLTLEELDSILEGSRIHDNGRA